MWNTNFPLMLVCKTSSFASCLETIYRFLIPTTRVICGWREPDPKRQRGPFQTGHFFFLKLQQYNVRYVTLSIAMEAASISSTSFSITPISNTTPSSNYSKSNTVSFSFRRRSRRFCSNNLIANGRSAAAPVAAAINDVSAVAHPAQVEVTWQIIVGTIGIN